MIGNKRERDRKHLVDLQRIIYMYDGNINPKEKEDRSPPKPLSRLEPNGRNVSHGYTEHKQYSVLAYIPIRVD